MSVVSRIASHVVAAVAAAGAVPAGR